MEAKLIKTKEGFYHLKFKNDDDMMECSLGLLSLKNCRSIERGYDLDELAYDCSIEWHGEKMDSAMEVYKEGFKKALDIHYNDMNILPRRTEWDVEIEMDILNEYDSPKLDDNGYLILKRI